MNRINKWIGIAAFSLMIVGLPVIASAQYGNGGYGYPNGGNNNGSYGNNGRYGNGGDQRSIIRDLKNRTREFQRELDRDLDNSRYNGSRREDQINQVARDFRNAVNNLDSNGRDYNEIQRVQQLGSEMDRMIGRSGISYNTQNMWQSVRSELQALGGSGYYDNGRNNRNSRTNGGRNNGGWSNRPSWWPF
ncbi:MAG TPA: hypothetical protein VGO43_14895 [Pyrinomonadaceae bacterium]|jgi:hypothetical protein|nr:hypothetical protein [Pyrinomonadaceae bacterium]